MAKALTAAGPVLASYSDRAARGIRRDHRPGRRGAGRAGPGRRGGLRRGHGAHGTAQPLIFEPPTYHYKVGVAFLPG